jgi:putative RNA 2'-phosphotransferase
MSDIRSISKRLSYWLRHRPDAARLELDQAGWADLAAVRQALGRDSDRLAEVIATNDKQRFELSPDGSRIRARQGHSVPVELDWPNADPPKHLYHGTVERFLAAIRLEGLKPMNRHHVHLSPDPQTAAAVGARRGKAVILKVEAAALAATGQPFFLTANGVWLTGGVPPQFLSDAG